MKIHISLNVSDIDRSVSFYKRMLDSEPVKYISRKKGEASSVASGYAKFDIANPPLNLALNERAVTKGEGLSHLGLEVESTNEVIDFKERWENSGLITAEEMDVICCYARQDKAWVRDPDGNEWEAFTVLENVEEMDDADASCCAGDKTPENQTWKRQTGETDVGADPTGTSTPVAPASCC